MTVVDSDTETDSDERQDISDSKDEAEISCSKLQSNEFLEEILNLIRDAVYHDCIVQ